MPIVSVPIGVAAAASSFARRGEPVAIGVALARGQARPEEPWAVVDANGAMRVAQTGVLDRWSDGSIRWLLVEFMADAAAQAPSIYTLRNVASPATADQLSIATADGAFTVDTGPAAFRLATSGALVIAEAKAGAHTVFTDLSIRALDAEGGEHALAIRHALLVRSGPVSAVFRLRGALTSASGADWLDTAITLQFFAGLGAVRVELSCTNRRAASHPGGMWDLGDSGSVLIRDLSVTLRPTPPGGAVVHASLDRREPLTDRGDQFSIYQDSSGGVNWQSVNHVNRDGKVTTSFRGFRAEWTGGEATGLRATPVVSLGSGDSRLTVAAPYFWEVFPKALVLSRASCALGILPAQSSDVHELQGGERVTCSFVLAVGDDRVTAEPLAWVRSPLSVSVDPDVYRRASLWAPIAVGATGARERYQALVDGIVSGEAPFQERREVIDEFGWRNFGDIYADHEAIDQPGRISHYNNQYDAVAGMAVRFMETGDRRWWTGMCELAAHVADIDLYNTTSDRAAYSGGYFWHTQHYKDAGTATHRAYSRRSVSYGGGPSNEHNYTSGLLLHYFLTGCERSKAAVLQLADWVVNMDDGGKSRFRWLDRGQTGLASSTRSPDFHGPGRGAGNSINTLLDAHRVSGEARYLEKADALVARCVHPSDDQDALVLLDAENRWSYTVFLQTLGKYLDHRAELGLVDERFAYAREVLVNYARWMRQRERFYLDRPEALEFPNETWAAQDIRKAAVFEFAARHASDESERAAFLARATEFFDYAVNHLWEVPTGRLARPLVLLLAYGFQRPLQPVTAVAAAVSAVTAAPRSRFVAQRIRVVRRLKIIVVTAAAAALLAIARWLL